jgi:hypothetical protein
LGIVVLVHEQRLNQWRLTIGLDGFELPFVFNKKMLGKRIGIDKRGLGEQLYTAKYQDQ